jgi:hypothetical protein
MRAAAVWRIRGFRFGYFCTFRFAAEQNGTISFLVGNSFICLIENVAQGTFDMKKYVKQNECWFLSFHCLSETHLQKWMPEL